jgi:large subunit ribosomal protein L15
MQIHDLKVKTHSGKKRVGRGGKKGTYSGKGMNGQKSRSGFSARATFEGGMSTLVARTKKNRGKGMTSLKEKNQIVALGELDKKFEAGQEINPVSLKEKGLIKDVKTSVKILNNGEITKAYTFVSVKLSESVKNKIEKAGGKINA